MIEEIAPLPPNRDYLQNIKMKKKFDWLNRISSKEEFRQNTSDQMTIKQQFLKLLLIKDIHYIKLIKKS